MAPHRTRWATGVILTAIMAAALAACSDDGSASSAVSKAASAAQSVGGQATAAVSSLASQASEALASATAEAGRRLDKIKGGVDARGDVRLGAPATASDGRTTVEVTAENTEDSTKSFAVQVNFKDSGGNLLDTVVVTVSKVPAGKSGTGTARSTHELSGKVKAEAGRALRY